MSEPNNDDDPSSTQGQVATTLQSIGTINDRSRAHLAFGMQCFKDGFTRSAQAAYLEKRTRVEKEYKYESILLKRKFEQRAAEVLAAEAAELKGINEAFARDPVEAFRRFSRAIMGESSQNVGLEAPNPPPTPSIEGCVTPRAQRMEQAVQQGDQDNVQYPISPATTVQPVEADATVEDSQELDTRITKLKRRAQEPLSTSAPASKIPRGVTVPISKHSITRKSEIAKLPIELMTRQQSVFLLSALRNINFREYSQYFRHPLTPQQIKEFDIPDYFDIIARPMDLSTMEAKLGQDEYASVQEFTQDLELIVSNTEEYNGVDHEVSEDGRALWSEFLEVWKCLALKARPLYTKKDFWAQD